MVNGIKYKADKRKLMALLNKLKKNYPQLKFEINDNSRVSLSVGEKGQEGEKGVSKEIIRRLRIQNKKLLEQVVRLKEEIKNYRKNQSLVMSHINEVMKMISH